MPMIRTLRVLTALGIGAAVACGDAGGASEPAPDTGEIDVAPQAFGELLSVDQIAVYQGVKVSLVHGAERVEPNAPVIPDRPALIRMHTRIPLGSKVPKLTAELRVRAPGQPDLVLVSGPRNIVRFDEGELSSSFYWELTADQVREGARLSVEIYDPSGVDASVIHYPADGELPMNVGALAPTLKVRFVPIEYQADGSNRVPVMDKRTIDAYRDSLYKMYPVSKVDITVRDVVAWPFEVRGSGEGWNQLLDAVIRTRENDEAADDVYYVGVFTPAETQREYCQAGCILGVAPAQTLGDSVSLRTAMIVGYHSERSHGTLAQELAHAMGRMHAPCGNPVGIDRSFPYSDGSIGTWGWDVLERRFIDPEGVHDFMSYCNPVWVSDYTFAAIYDRMVEVERDKRPEVGAPDREPMKTYHVEKDGSLWEGPAIRGGARSSDELVLEDGSHEAIGAIRGSYHPISNVGGGILVTPTEIPAGTLRRARFARPVGR